MEKTTEGRDAAERIRALIDSGRLSGSGRLGAGRLPPERKLAESQALDPESAGETFEPLARPGLLARLRA